MPVIYKDDITPAAKDIIVLYNNAGLPRPTEDEARIKKMYDNSNLIITAWDADNLVGIVRCITDSCWSCYLSDLAVAPGYQKEGIGKKLIEHTRNKLGEEVMILLLSVPSAMSYYPKAGFTKEDRAFAIFRTR
ncbi:MAG TPA: GNAT family N-acetyltransferase [Ferruginibacter sp.]|nr:GNAT family N-acetyltransferase [Ferruginibacter sp.]